MKEQLKQFGAKGLKGCYLGGENVEAGTTDVLSICEVLVQKGCSPVEMPLDVLDGLTISSHLLFRKVFAVHRADLDNPMNTTEMTGTILEQITQMLETAQGMHTAFCLTTGNDAWIGTGRLSSYTMGTKKGKKTVKCDNCQGDHYLICGKKKMNEANIAKNKAARGAPASSYLGGCGGGRGGGRGAGRGGGRGDTERGRGGCQPRGKDRPPANCDARGKFGAPKPHERVRVIDGKAMAACRTCGWNDGAGCHSSGSHELSLE